MDMLQATPSKKSLISKVSRQSSKLGSPAKLLNSPRKSKLGYSPQKTIKSYKSLLNNENATKTIKLFFRDFDKVNITSDKEILCNRIKSYDDIINSFCQTFQKKKTEYLNRVEIYYINNIGLPDKINTYSDFSGKINSWRYTKVHKLQIATIDSKYIKPNNKEFYLKIRKLITCTVCFSVLLDPVSCATCNTAYCRSCLQSRMDNELICPLGECDSILISEEIDKSILFKLGKVNMDCKYSKECKAEINLLNYHLHDSICTFKNLEYFVDIKIQDSPKFKKSFTTLGNLNTKVESFEDIDQNKYGKLIKNKLDGCKTVLYLGCSDFGFEGIQFLSYCQFLNKLKDLYLQQNNIGDEGLYFLRECKFLSQLKALYLWDNKITSEGLKSIYLCKYLDQLQVLDLYSNKIDSEGMKYMSGCYFLHNLKYLNLNDNHIGSEGVKFLSCCRYLTNLVKLSIGNNNIKATGMKYLSDCVFLTNLTSLDLYNNHLGSKGILHLFDCLFLTKLEELQLSFNDIGEEGMQHLKGCSFLSNLISLHLGHNNIESYGMLHFADMIFLTNLKELLIGNNKLGQEGINFLAECTFLTELNYLDLENNNLGPEGINNFSKCKFMSKLTNLTLANNNIQDEGVEYLKKCDFLEKVEHINLRGNKIRGLDNGTSIQQFLGSEFLNHVEEVHFESNMLLPEVEKKIKNLKYKFNNYF